MKTTNSTLLIRTNRKQEMLDLTASISDAVASSGIRDGLIGVYCQHTTAALFVSESQQALIEDIGGFLQRIVDDSLPYRHNTPEFSDCDRKNAASHLRSLLLNHSVLLPVVDGRTVLGQFQSIILAELDGPRERAVRVQVLGE